MDHPHIHGTEAPMPMAVPVSVYTAHHAAQPLTDPTNTVTPTPAWLGFSAGGIGWPQLHGQAMYQPSNTVVPYQDHQGSHVVMSNSNNLQHYAVQGTPQPQKKRKRKSPGKKLSGSISENRVVYNSMPPCAGTNVYSFQAYPQAHTATPSSSSQSVLDYTEQQGLVQSTLQSSFIPSKAPNVSTPVMSNPLVDIPTNSDTDDFRSLPPLDEFLSPSEWDEITASCSTPLTGGRKLHLSTMASTSSLQHGTLRSHEQQFQQDARSNTSTSQELQKLLSPQVIPQQIQGTTLSHYDQVAIGQPMFDGSYNQHKLLVTSKPEQLNTVTVSMKEASGTISRPRIPIEASMESRTKPSQEDDISHSGEHTINKQCQQSATGCSKKRRLSNYDTSDDAMSSITMSSPKKAKSQNLIGENMKMFEELSERLNMVEETVKESQNKRMEDLEIIKESQNNMADIVKECLNKLMVVVEEARDELKVVRKELENEKELRRTLEEAYRGREPRNIKLCENPEFCCPQCGHQLIAITKIKREPDTYQGCSLKSEPNESVKTESDRGKEGLLAHIVKKKDPCKAALALMDKLFTIEEMSESCYKAGSDPAHSTKKPPLDQKRTLLIHECLLEKFGPMYLQNTEKVTESGNQKCRDAKKKRDANKKCT